MFGNSRKAFLSMAIASATLLGSMPFASAEPGASPIAPVAQTSTPDIGALEQKFFGRVYDKDATDKRIQRLELLMFGGTQDGGLVERLDRVSKYAVDHAKTPKTAQSAGADNASLSALERKILKKTFDAETPTARLTRLESKVFGTPSPSMSPGDRVVRLKKLLNIETPSISRVPSYNNRMPDMDMDMITPFSGTGPNGITIVPFPMGRGDNIAQQMDEMMRQLSKSLRTIPRMPPSRGIPRSGSELPDMTPFYGPNSPFSQPLTPRALPQRKQDTELPPYLDPNSI